MRLSERIDLPVSPERAWRTVVDPRVIGRTLPGLVTFEVLGDGPATRWTGLQVLDSGPATVEFVASWEGGRMHEVSRFEQRAGRWVYVDGVVVD